MTRTLFSVESLARIVLEAAASAAWLNNDGVDGETTLARHIKIHQKSIRSERDRIKKVKKHGIAAESPERLDQMLTGCKAQLDECATAHNHLGNARNAVVPSKSQIVSEVLSLINLTDFPQLGVSSSATKDVGLLRRSGFEAIRKQHHVTSRSASGVLRWETNGPKCSTWPRPPKRPRPSLPIQATSPKRTQERRSP